MPTSLCPHNNNWREFVYSFNRPKNANLCARQGKKSAGRILLGWWWWTARTCCQTQSLWTAGSAMWTCSLERGSCWGSVSTASARSACVQSSCWVRSRRCPVPTEMTHIPAPVPCRRGRSELWCQQRSMNAGCREVCQWQSLDVRAATTVPPLTVRAGVCTRTQSTSSTALSAVNTTASFARYEINSVNSQIIQ